LSFHANRATCESTPLKKGPRCAGERKEIGGKASALARMFRSTRQQGRSAKQIKNRNRPNLINSVKLEGVTAAYIFGSWAARYSGEQGADPGDVDVLLVGQFERFKAFEAALQAARQVGKEINVNNLSADEWEAGELGFVKTLKSRPLIQIIGSTPSD